MKRITIVAGILGATLAAILCLRSEIADAAPAVADLSGLWRMRETHENFEGTLRWTWLEIRQDGDRLEIRAWEDGDAWTAAGKGRVENTKALFLWWGQDKRWRGTAVLELRGGELRGVFQRLDVEGIGPQYCRGSESSRRIQLPASRFPPRRRSRL